MPEIFNLSLKISFTRLLLLFTRQNQRITRHFSLVTRQNYLILVAFLNLLAGSENCPPSPIKKSDPPQKKLKLFHLYS